MKHTDNKFSIEEVERLCQLYIDCQLTVLEETELEYVLMHCDNQSSLINETKELMAVSRSVKLTAVKPRNNAWALRVAACVAIILGTFAIYIYHHNSIMNNCDDNCIVYVAGKRASADEAHKIAEADVARMQQFMQTVNEQQAHEEAKVEQFINHINQSK